eukprot:m.60390 g.60390  ORF g.60390 m.60390 type:complete len:370 (-) comp16086_c0_seq1:55-1164(-)
MEGPPPSYSASLQTQQPGATAASPMYPPATPTVVGAPFADKPPATELDALTVAKLNAIEKFEIRQGNVLLEAVTGGIWPNTYIIGDAGRPVQVRGKPTPTPVFIVKEESSCCARLWCPGTQSLTAKVYHAQNTVQEGNTCCGCYTGHKYRPDLTVPAAMTLEREGCCSKWLGCCACGDCCQNDMYALYGERDVKPGKVKNTNDYFGRSYQPKWGGCFTPTVNMFLRGEQDPFATVTGPTFFAGWLGVCCDTIFQYWGRDKSGAGREKELGRLVKPRAHSVKDCCIQQFTDVDHYVYSVGPDFASLKPDEKAMVLANVIQLDYMFFENDLPPVYFVKGDGNSLVIVCTLFEVYCAGCVWPCCIAIPVGGN